MNLLLTQQKRHFFLSFSLTFAVTAMGCVDGDIQNKAQVWAEKTKPPCDCQFMQPDPNQ